MPILALVDLAQWTAILVFVAAFATVVAVALPFLRRDERAARLRQLARQRDEVRSRTRAAMEKERLAARRPS